MADPIRLMIADDEDSVREALSSLLASDPGIIVVGEASDAQGAIEVAAARHPTVALLDVRMPQGGGPRAASEITHRSPGTSVIALSSSEDADSILQMLDAGAAAYVSKADDTEKIFEAIHRIAEDPQSAAESIRERPPLEEVFRHTGWMDRRRERSRRVNEALLAGGPRMVYQPLFDITEGRCIGMEALSRFDTMPDRSPDKWFADADQVGLQAEMELMAVHSALGDLARLDRDLILCVNVSPDTCGSPELAEAIEQSQADRLVIEITEHTPITDYEELSAWLAPLRALGVRIAVDDTGAGFASLSHVLRLSPELIKLDLEVCRGVESDSARTALVRALAAFASQVGAAIVAEGIGSPMQLIALRDAGVRYGQGSFLGDPQPLQG